MSISKRLFRTGLAALVQRLVKSFDQILLVPIFLSAWGASYYGEWLTLMSIPTIIGFSEFGFGAAASAGFVLKYSAGDIRDAADLAKSGMVAISLAIAGAFLLSAGAILAVDQFDYFQHLIIPRDESIVALVLMVASRVICFYHPIFDGYLVAAKRAHVSMNLQSVHSVVTLGATLVVLLSGFGAIWLAAVNFAAALLFTVFFWIFSIRSSVAIEVAHGSVRREYLRMLMRKGTAYLMTPIWQAILFQGTTIVVRVTLGPVAVAAFNTARTITRSVNQLYTIVISATLAELQLSLGQGKLETARQLFRLSLGLIVLAAAFGSVLLAIWGTDLYRVWTNKSIAIPEGMLQVLCVGILFNALWWPASFIFQAANRPGLVAKAGLAGSVLTIILTYVLTVNFGLLGAGTATVAMEVVMLVVILPQACVLLQQPLKTLLPTILEDWRRIVRDRGIKESVSP
jgi:O-antigen/teichoic acid export membrane protein